MSDERFDYEQQQSEERRRYWEATEGRRQAMRDAKALEAHRKWLAEFKSQEKSNA